MTLRLEIPVPETVEFNANQSTPFQIASNPLFGIPIAELNVPPT